jgi:effector-binding domain-containing protein
VQKLLYGVGAFIALLIVIGFALPRTHSTEVSIEIDAHPATVFALLNDFRRHALWSPMVDSDPNVRILYSGNSKGIGATMTWDGAIVGSGTQTIIESKPYEQVQIVISPGEPGEAHSRFDISTGTGTTIVTWGFTADYGMNIVGRYFASMLGSIVARDYQSGLKNLKELAESLPTADFSDTEIEHLVVEATEIAYISATSSPDPAAISAVLGKAYFQILSFIGEQELDVAGAPLSITRTFSGGQIVFDAAIPVRGVTEATPRDGATVKLGLTYNGPVIRAEHIGSYRTLSETHRKISAYLAAHGIERNGDAWESYASDPSEVPEKDLLTYVYYPIKPANQDDQTDLTRNGGTRPFSSSPSPNPT